MSPSKSYVGEIPRRSQMGSRKWRGFNTGKCECEPKKNFRGQALLSAETTVPSDEQFAGKGGNGQEKNKGRPSSAFQGYTPEALVQQVECICTAPFNNDSRGRGNT